MKVVVAAFNQEKALVGAFSVITNLRMQVFEALLTLQVQPRHGPLQPAGVGRHHAAGLRAGAVPRGQVCSTSKSSIRRFVITEKAATWVWLA